MKNTVELLGFYGGDITHGQSGWTSTIRELTPRKTERLPQFLQLLAIGDGITPHYSPFEKSSLHFLLNTDIATHIHLLKHRHVSINAESARYKELKEDKFYLPDDFPPLWKTELENHTRLSLHLYHQCLKSLVEDYGFTRKRAKESARFFRTYNTQITADVMFNFSSFLHFQKLRNSEHAQKEVREIAQKMLDLVKAIPGQPFQYSIAAFKL